MTAAGPVRAAQVAAARVAAVLLLLVVSGCGTDLSAREGVPECEPSGELVVIAQAVPSAGHVPCIEMLPIGWDFAGMDVRRGRARFWLGNDRAGARAVRVTLESTCDTSTATELPSDHPSTQRFLRLDQLGSRNTGAWLHTFDGGCTTYDFAVPERSYDFDAFNVELHAALDFFPRGDIAAEVLDRFDAELDPATDVS